MTTPATLTENQAAVLAIVAVGPVHAYGIAQSGDIGEALARKMLRELAQLGLVKSVISASTIGPPRRIYSTTEAGRSTARPL